MAGLSFNLGWVYGRIRRCVDAMGSPPQAIHKEEARGKPCGSVVRESA